MPTPRAIDLAAPAEADGAGPRPGPAPGRQGVEQLAELAGVFAHDLKNPLSALLLGVQRLTRLASPDQRPQAQALLARLEGSIHSMSRMIDWLSDLARLEAGTLRLSRERGPASPVISRAVEAVRGLAAERRLTLEVDLGPDLPEVDWDQDRVAEAVEHLLGNVLRRAPEGSSVKFSCRLGREGLVLAAQGSAEGDPPAASPELAPGRRQRNIGLLLARGIIEAHGGRLEPDPGAGSPAPLRAVLPTAGAPAPER